MIFAVFSPGYFCLSASITRSDFLLFSWFGWFYFYFRKLFPKPPSTPLQSPFISYLLHLIFHKSSLDYPANAHSNYSLGAAICDVSIHQSMCSFILYLNSDMLVIIWLYLLCSPVSFSVQLRFYGLKSIFLIIIHVFAIAVSSPIVIWQIIDTHCSYHLHSLSNPMSNYII